MSDLTYLILGSLIGSTLSIIGGVVLLSNRKSAEKLALLATPFAAGTLLAAAFFDLLPDALEHNDSTEISAFVLIGIVIFFLLQRFLHIFHHQHGGNDETRHTGPLIITGDTLHNALDGIAIAAAFLVNPPTGFIASLAVAMHEVPQEVGDFGVLLKLGYKKRKVLLINILSSLATTPVAVAVFLLGDTTWFPAGPLLGLTVGFFIYIAAADLIPRIHNEAKKRFAWLESSLLVLAIIIVGIITSLAHSYIEVEDDHESTKAQVETTQ